MKGNYWVLSNLILVLCYFICDSFVDTLVLFIFCLFENMLIITFEIFVFEIKQMKVMEDLSYK